MSTLRFSSSLSLRALCCLSLGLGVYLTLAITSPALAADAPVAPAPEIAPAVAAPEAPAPPAAPVDADLAPFTGLKGTMHIAGGSIHVPIMMEAAQKIMAHNRNLIITVAGGGTEVGLEQVIAGRVQIGNTGRALTEVEMKKHNLQDFAMATDALVVVVHPSNPLKNLSKNQLAFIYAGDATEWSQVDGAAGHDLPIHVFSREPGTGTRQGFIDNALNGGTISNMASVLSSNGAMRDSVATDKRGIGFLSLGFVNRTVKPLTLEGREATQESMLDKSYPVLRQLHMAVKNDASPLVKAFVDFIYSPSGAKIIEKCGYLPLKR